MKAFESFLVMQIRMAGVGYFGMFLLLESGVEILL
jgi:hypothetical protein